MKDVDSGNNGMIADEEKEQQFKNSLKVLEEELAKIQDEVCAHNETVDLLNMTTEGCPNSLPKSFPTKALRGFKLKPAVGDSQTIKFN